jgi:hypothetical protein
MYLVSPKDARTAKDTSICVATNLLDTDLRFGRIVRSTPRSVTLAGTIWLNDPVAGPYEFEEEDIPLSRFLRLVAHAWLLAALTTILLSPHVASANITLADCSSCQGLPAARVLPQLVRQPYEGNLGDTYSVARVRGAFGVTLDFHLIYNSYNADGSRNMYPSTGCSIDTVMVYDRTDMCNDFLFSQREFGGDMFRFGPDGRITRLLCRPTAATRPHRQIRPVSPAKCLLRYAKARFKLV